MSRVRQKGAIPCVPGCVVIHAQNRSTCHPSATPAIDGQAGAGHTMGLGGIGVLPASTAAASRMSIAPRFMREKRRLWNGCLRHRACGRGIQLSGMGRRIADHSLPGLLSMQEAHISCVSSLASASRLAVQIRQVMASGYAGKGCENKHRTCYERMIAIRKRRMCRDETAQP